MTGGSQTCLGWRVGVQVPSMGWRSIRPRRHSWYGLYGSRWGEVRSRRRGALLAQRSPNPDDRPETLVQQSRPNGIPRKPVFARVDTNRYREWQTLAFEATEDKAKDAPEDEVGP
ncbi:hypothetical protein ON010_g15980 [Phytophthora cinnamomi]|nr:hypothetical protein ON010_g15980 [Phytophthora cinnamomi]